MFEASRTVLFLDDFRVPYRTVAGDEPWASLRHRDRELRWISEDHAEGLLRELHLGHRMFFAKVVSDAEMADALPRGKHWLATLPITDGRGVRVASVWRSGEGDVALPFDPDEAITTLRSERYLRAGHRRLTAGTRDVARRLYYRIRPMLPRSGQIRLRQAFSRVQARRQFPRWPVEPALHDLYALLFGLLRDVAGQPVPTIAPWPRDYSWALVLTHDVETAAGYEQVPRLLALEEELGFRSSWNFVPLRDYRVEDAMVAELRARGFEVGVHGLHHDGLDFDSEAMFAQRLPQIRTYADRWDAVGFRSPATHRVWEWMPRLGFDYDSSYTDSAPYEPQPGGCCSWLPFSIDDLVELPITLPQDHTVFEILGQADESLWLEKARLLRARGGMALILTHPDYMVDGPTLPAYERFLQSFANDPTAWKALPREVSDWWRRRKASRIERRDGRWVVSGPAEAEAEVELAGESVEAKAA